MGWFNNLFRPKPADSGRESEVQPSVDPFTIRNQDDETYRSNRDVIKALRFSVTLQIRTPLSTLAHHGELYEGLPSTAPRYGEERDGQWQYEIKSFAELGVDLPDFGPSTAASDIGPVDPSDYLPFLIAFRKIIESDTPHAEKLAQVKALPKTSAKFAEFWRKLRKNDGDFPESFFYLQLTDLPGVGKRTAKNLYEAGFTNLESVTSATEESLLQIPGLGRGTVQKILGAETQKH